MAQRRAAQAEAYSTKGNSSFLAKTYDMIEDPTTKPYVRWAPAGNSFVLNPLDAAKYVLPKFFKHCNISSFIRQLNMYGFRKVSTANSDWWQFEHDIFRRGNKAGIKQIKRKTTAAGSTSAPSTTHPAVQIEAASKDGLEKVKLQVKRVKDAQSSGDTKLEALTEENRQLKRKVEALTETLDQTNANVSKIMAFLKFMSSDRKRGGNAFAEARGSLRELEPEGVLPQDDEVLGEKRPAKRQLSATFPKEVEPLFELDSTPIPRSVVSGFDQRPFVDFMSPVQRSLIPFTGGLDPLAVNNPGDLGNSPLPSPRSYGLGLPDSLLASPKAMPVHPDADLASEVPDTSPVPNITGLDALFPTSPLLTSRGAPPLDSKNGFNLPIPLSPFN